MLFVEATPMPGKGQIAMLAADRASAEITTAENNLKGTAIDYHFVHLYGGGLLWNLWVMMLDLSSLGAIVFAVSGVCIWATSRERDRGSWSMLAAGLVLTVGTVLYYMFAC